VYCNRSCLSVCLWVCGWDCYHDNTKLRASILTKLGLWVKVVTIFSGLNFGRPTPPGMGLHAAGRNFWLHLTTASTQCLRLLRALFYRSVMQEVCVELFFSLRACISPLAWCRLKCEKSTI